MPNKFQVTDDDAMLDNAECVVCVLSSDSTIFTDNKHGVCSMCGVGVQWRPHAPEKPKVCMRCAAPMMAESLAAHDLHVILTTATAGEVEAFLRRQKQ
jgi:hypothetical protein